jgi:hypothetical protein
MPTREVSPIAQFSALLLRFPPGIVALVKRCMPKLRRAVPCSHELVYEYPSSLVVAFGMSERGYEAIMSVAVSAHEVRLYFDKSLPDPNRLLQGSGTKVRSMTVAAASDLDRVEMKVLFKAANEHAGATVPRTGKTRMIIKSALKKPPAKKPKPRRSPLKALTRKPRHSPH